MRYIACFMLALFWAAPHAHAQSDSIFPSYEAYGAFVDKHIMTRDFSPLILRLGGRDEYTAEQIAENNAQLRRVWPRDFEHATVFRREDLGGGVHQEGRMYWTGTGYAFFYALLHQRDDGFVVISFHLNTNSKNVLARF